MKLKPEHIDKIDPLLEQALKQARGNEKLVVVMSLELKKPLVSSPFHPKEFPSYEEYRKALIDYRKREFAEGLEETFQELRNLSLKTTGGTLSNVLGVQGTAKQILQALELPGVRHATIDQMIGLPSVAPVEAIERMADIYIGTLWPDEPPDRRTLETVDLAAEQYILNYDKQYNKLRILGMQEPVDLESIYMTVQLINSHNVRRFGDYNHSLKEVYGQVERFGFEYEKSSKEAGIDVANKTQYLMVLGQPGSGKSTFLRKIGLEAIKVKPEGFKHDCIPVLLELKLFNEKSIDIEKSIVEAFSNCRFPEAEWFTDRALKAGNLLILLDGLDEISTAKQEETIYQIKEFVKRYRKNRFIVSCRMAAYHSYLKQFTEVVITEFEDRQSQEFIQKWFQSEEHQKARTAQNCWELLNKPEYKSTKELAKTPLLLVFICLVYEELRDRFPKNRASLYSEALDIFLKRWAADKKLQLAPSLRKFGLDLEKVMLSELAYQGFEKDRLFFSREDIICQISNYINDRYGLITSHLSEGDELAAEMVLDAIEVQQGIIVERAQDTYSFSHLTLQEYLTAQYIVDNSRIEWLGKEQMLIWEVFKKYWRDKSWWEVLRSSCGMIREKVVGEIIEFLMAQDGEYDDFMNLFLAAECLSEVKNRFEIEDASAKLLDALKSLKSSQYKNYWVQREAVRAIGSHYKENPQTLFWLQQHAVSDEHEDVRREAVRAIASNYKENPQVLIWLQQLAVSDEHEYVRREAVRAIASNYKENPQVLIWLQQLAVSDKNEWVRGEAVRAIASNYKENPQVLIWLQQLAVSDKNQFVRGEVVSAIASNYKENPQVLIWLQQLAVSGEHLSVRWKAVSAIASNYKGNPQTLRWLQHLAVSDNHESVRPAAVSAISSNYKENPEILFWLEQLAVFDKNESVRRKAVEGLSKYWSYESRVMDLLCESDIENNPFEDQYDIEDDNFQIMSIKSLLEPHRHNPQALKLLRYRAENDSNEKLRKFVKKLLDTEQ